MKRIIVTILSLLLLMISGCVKSDDSSKPGIIELPPDEWYLVYEAEDSNHYSALCFSDENNGWVIGDSGIVLHTEDGGNSWETIQSETESDLKCIHFSGSENGWIAGSYDTLGLTTDGGESWSWQQIDGLGGTFTDIYFYDELTGWLVNNYGKILHTEDGGVTWVLQDSGTDRALASVFFIDAETGWAIKSEREILRTEDGGNTWTGTGVNISLPGGTLFTDVFFVDSKEGWITTTTMASSGSRVTWSPLLYTRDSGESWYVQATPPDKWLKRIIMKDRKVGWLLGMGELYYTNDGGDSWNFLLETGGDPLVDLFITDSNRVFTLTFSGSVFAMRFTDELFKSAKYELKVGEIPGEIKEIGKNIQYSSQCIWGDLFVGVESMYEHGLIEQNIFSYNLNTGEKECLIAFDPSPSRVDPPSIYKNLIVWTEADISGMNLRTIDWSALYYDVYLFDMDTGETRQITDDEYIQEGVVISGRWIAWFDNRHGTGERYPYPASLDIYAYNLDTGEEKRITSETTAEGYGHLAISGDLIVWSDSRHAKPVENRPSNVTDYNNEIYAYNLKTGEEQQITDYPGNDHYPAIQGNRIAWLRQLDLQKGEIVVYDLDTGVEIQVSSSGYAVYTPSLYEDLVVWSDAGISKGNTCNDVVINGQGGAADIYLYDFNSGEETLLIPNVVEMEYKDTVFNALRVLLNPVINKNYVVYTCAWQVDPVVYVKTLGKN
ncbi:YCF48-related protein [Chloroflexota bacterium]